MDNYFRGDEKEAARVLEEHFKEEMGQNVAYVIQGCGAEISGFFVESGGPRYLRQTGWMVVTASSMTALMRCS